MTQIKNNTSNQSGIIGIIGIIHNGKSLEKSVKMLSQTVKSA